MYTSLTNSTCKLKSALLKGKVKTVKSSLPTYLGGPKSLHAFHSTATATYIYLTYTCV